MTRIKSSLQSVRGILRGLLSNLRQTTTDDKNEYPTQQNQYFT